jgi:photosystem II stability/assembly factor-like uncharacterized protein
MGSRRLTLAFVVLAGGALAAFGVARSTAPRTSAPAELAAPQWPQQRLTGDTILAGQVPVAVASGRAHFLRHRPASASVTLNFGLPLTHSAAMNLLIAQEAKTHHYLARKQLYARFTPPPAQVDAVRGWLRSKGFQITHVGVDHLAVTATATTAQAERALHVRINEYVRPGFTFRKVKVAPYVYYANTTAPQVPASLGLQAISGLSDVDRFFTQVQLDRAAAGCDDSDAGPVNPLCIEVRSGGYFPTDLRGLYDITGHGYDGTGQTLGFTLWTAPEKQAAMTAFASTTGDQPITIDPSCTATANSPTVPSSCSVATVGADHLMFILENGNVDPGTNFGSNVETALDIEAAHGIATHAGLKYYASECATNPPAGSGLANAGCNGSDVGLEDALEDAANDPTLHSVSNSWAFGGEAEWGLADPFLITANASLALGAAAGTTFYFSTGDSGTYQSGYPSDSPYVVAVGGTSTFSTGTPATYSTSTTWSGSGSWCSNIVPRPAWQTGAGVTANAPCPGRVIPDVSAVADPATGVRFTSTTATGTQSGQVGGTSLAAPVMNGLQGVMQNFVNAQTYPGPTPSIGFMGPMLYQLGNSGHYSSYYRDIVCGNTANPTSGPDGDAAQPGWDAATGWGEPDWFNFATGAALQLGATNLTVPPSLATGFSWACAKTPSNSTERGISCPTTSVCYAVGSASGGTPWPGKFLPSGAWGAVNTFFKSTDGGKTWFPSNSDMLSISCTSAPTCIEVGVGGRARRTTDGGSTWSDVPTGYDKPLTQVRCPSSSTCYAAGDRGTMLKSTDGGQTWSYLASTDGNPIYGLACPDTNTCYATDIYGHVLKTTDGGATFEWQQTPITTPGLGVPGSGGPNPFAGLMSIACSSTTTCVATGLYVVPTGAGQTLPSSDPPIVTTTDGGATWTLRTSNAGGAPVSTTLSAAATAGSTNIKVASVSGFSVGKTMVVDTGVSAETVTITTVGTAGASGTGVTFTPALAFAHASGVSVTTQNPNSPNYLHAIACLPGTTTCTAVGRSGAIVTTTDLVNWTPMTSNTTVLLDSIYCSSASFCIAGGQNGTVDVYNGSTWTATTGNGSTGTIAALTCDGGNLVCYATGKQGVTLRTTTGGTAWTTQAGGGTTNQMNGVSCPNAATCFAVGAGGTILQTSNGGQTWIGLASGTTQALNGISCTSTTACSAVGAAGSALLTTNGASWSSQVSGTTNALNGVSCAGGSCWAAGASGTILVSTDGGATWTGVASGTTVALNAISCASATTCYATGAVAAGSAVMLKTTDGALWVQQASHSAAALNGLACLDGLNCFAGGASGTVVATSDGATWAQQGNPLGGPTTALNATAITLNNAACTWSRCFMGTGAQGDIMDAPLVTVTVNTSSVYGTAPNLAAIPAANYSVSPAGSTVTGTLTCTTTVTNASHGGSYPYAGCSGLSDQGFDVVYDYADSAHHVLPADQTITFASIPDHTFGDPDFPLGATASSGLDVVYTPTGKCTVAGGFVHLTGAGSCSIQATQPGNSDYNAAPAVTQGFAIAKSDQTIDFAVIPDVQFGNSDFIATPTATSGLDVTLTVTSGSCTVTPAIGSWTVHLTGAGSCTIKAGQPGNTDYNPAPDVSRSFSIAKSDQGIDFSPIPDHTFGDADFPLGAVATSGLPVSYAALGQCSVAAGMLHITGAGSCSVTASQAGNTNYNPASDVTHGFTISMAGQTISFAPIPDRTFGDPDFPISPTASSGLPVGLAVEAGSTCQLIPPATVHITGAGSCSIDATQGGNANYAAAPTVTRAFAIARADQTVAFAPIPDHTYGDADFAVSPTASSGLPVGVAEEGGSNCHVIGTTVHITGAGSCSIDATQGGNANYNAAPTVTRTFAIGKEGQTIVFPAIPNQVLGVPDFEIGATSDSRLPITFSVVSGPCTVAPGSSDYSAIVHLTGAGTCAIKASQGGDSNWLPATGVTQSFQIAALSPGNADGAGLQPASGGHADFHVDGNGPKAPSGNLTWNAPPPPPPAPGTKPPKPPDKPDHLEAKTITTFAISPDGHSAWFSGVGKDGRTFTAYIEDNASKPPIPHHPKPKDDPDVFKLWINGVLVTGDGSLKNGNVKIKQ